MTEVLIRPVAPADMAVLLAMLRNMAIYERLEHRFTATEEALGSALFGAAPIVHGVIAERDGTAAGFALWSFTFHTFRCEHGLFVEDVFVTDAARGTGAGYALFRALAREAKARNCTRMLWHVLDWNELALRFYERIGATAPDVDWVSRELRGDALTALAG